MSVPRLPTGAQLMPIAPWTWRLAWHNRYGEVQRFLDGDFGWRLGVTTGEWHRGYQTRNLALNALIAAMVTR